MRILQCVLIFTLSIATLYSSMAKEVVDSTLLNTYLGKAREYRYSNHDTCIAYANKAIELANRIEDSEKLIKVYRIKGRSFVAREDYTTATSCFLKALSIADALKVKPSIADLYWELGNIYAQLEKYQNALSYFKNALKLYEELSDTLSIGIAYNALGNLESSREYCEKRTEHQKQDDFKNALHYFEKSLYYAQLVKSNKGIGKGYQNIGNIYRKIAQPQKALEYTLKALETFRIDNDSASIINAYYNLGLVYAGLSNFKEARKYYEKCITESIKIQQTAGIQFIYEELAYVCEKLGDYKGARDNYVKYMTLRDSIYNAEKSQQMFELETKYQTVKKEKEITSLKAQEKLNTIYLVALVSILILLSVSGYFVYNNLKEKKRVAEKEIELKEQKFLQLEKDHQILAAQLVLQGEESERQRLARDLHDGLGGMLSGVKLSLHNMKGNAVLADENVKEFDRALDMLDSSIKELRRVAHNMMPEALIRFGLKDALTDFCQSLHEAQPMIIVFQFIGVFNRVDKNLEIGCFRIIQELVNNALKHSDAKELVVQMIQETGCLCFIVQDNGKGFDPKDVSGKKGIGLTNIKSRVESMNGVIDIYSAPGAGSEFTIEFSLN